MISRRRVICLVICLMLCGNSAGRAQESRESVRNQGEFNLVLIHGLGSSASVWDQTIPFLQKAFRVWLFELPGHGSTAPMPGTTIEGVAGRLAEFIRENGIEYPTLVGHGMGGLIAMRYTFDHPADVHRLIVLDAAPKQLLGPEHKEMIARSLVEDYDRFVASQFLAMSPDSSVTEQILDQALRTDSVSFVSLLMSTFDFDLTEELPRQAVPILVIGSAHLFPDPDLAKERLDQIGFGRARTVSFKQFEGTGHFIMLEQPTYLASVILAFVVSRPSR